MKVLITGGCGYIGSVLARTLSGHEVHIVDWLLTNPRAKETARLLEEKGFTVFYKDFRDLGVGNYDVVVHLAALVGFPKCDQFPTLAKEINHEGLRTLFGTLSLTGQIIYPNTNSQYGTSSKVCTEETECRPVSLYGQTKCQAEAWLQSFFPQKSTCLRLATVYGPSPSFRPELLVNTYVEEAMRGTITLYNPHVRRNYVYIKDVCRAIKRCIEERIIGVFNFGNDALNCTKRDLALRIAQILGAKVKDEGSLKDPDRRDYEVSSEKFMARVPGFEFTDFKESIHATVEGARWAFFH